MIKVKEKKLLKIYIVGEDKVGWALDTDARLAKIALEKFAIVVDKPWKADYIHSVSPNNTYQMWGGKCFVSFFPASPDYLFNGNPRFLEFCKNHICIVQAKQAESVLIKNNIFQTRYIPYIADMENFFPINDKAYIKRKYNIPNRQFIVGNFMRDTQGDDCISIKAEKGPDIFCDIVSQAMENIGKEKILVLLAGPRRMWIRNRLNELGVPFCFVGQIGEDGQDDWQINYKTSEQINELINACDLIIVSSRSEGGPRVIMEAATAKIPIISTRVGIAPDILDERCIYDDIKTGVELVVNHYKSRMLDDYKERNYDVVKKNHSVEVVSKEYQKLYQNYVGRKMKLVDIIRFGIRRISRVLNKMLCLFYIR